MLRGMPLASDSGSHFGHAGTNAVHPNENDRRRLTLQLWRDLTASPKPVPAQARN